MNQDLNTPPTESVTRLTTVNEGDNPEHFEADQTPEQQIKEIRERLEMNPPIDYSTQKSEYKFLLSHIDRLTESLEKANGLLKSAWQWLDYRKNWEMKDLEELSIESVQEMESYLKQQNIL